jgi:hypothetical protein
MMARTFILSAVAAFTFSSTARADTPEDIPEHVVRNIRLSVQPAEAIVVATVKAPPTKGLVSFRVDQTVMGSVPSELALTLDNFYAPELEPGTQMLVSVRRFKGTDRWMCTGRYEVIHEGRVREYSLDSYLAVMSEQIAKLEAKKSTVAVQPTVPPAPPTSERPSGTVAQTGI